MTDAVHRLSSALAGRYRIERELGRGGMATVYLAEDLKHRRRVAIKVLRPELAAALGPERFLREIETTASLRHPHILPLYDSGEADGFLFYVMPLVEGESLRERLARERQLPVEDALQVAREVADALSYAHSRGVVHRDIKPENILLEAGHAAVADFGIAKAVSAAAGATLTETGVTIGTPLYMSPEQAAGERDLDGRSDLYALGCVLYEMLAGQTPFTGPTVESVVHQHLTAEPRAVTELRPAVPAAVAAALQRALAKTPADRFNPVAQFAEALRPASPAGGGAAAPYARQSLAMRRVAAIGASLAVIALIFWLVAQRGRTGPGTLTEQRSLAVLPFESVGGDTANVYFAEGMADELTSALSKVSGLRVAATTSTFTFRNTTADVRDIARALNVSAVLQGRVRRAGSRLRIVAQLTNAADGLVLWSNSYEREVTDVFAVQDELTRDIVGALRITLAGAATPGGSPGTGNLDAYDLFLRGLYFFSQRGPGVERSIPYFRQALARDSTYTRAWAQLGTAYALLPLYSLLPADSAAAQARLAANQAQRLDPASAEAVTALGMTYVLANRWERALAEFDRAIALDPGYAFSYRPYMMVLGMLGRLDEALAQGRLAARLDPLAPNAHTLHSRLLLSIGRRAEALEAARRAVELDSLTPASRPALALAEYFVGNLKAARTLAQMGVRVPVSSVWIGFVLGATGDTAGAATLVQQVERERGRNAFVETTIAWIFLGSGDTTRALDALERAARAREPIGYVASFHHPAYDRVRGSARFAAVIRAFGLDPRVAGGRS